MKVHALLLGDRIDTAGLERTDVLSTTPLAFRAGQDGVVTVFRYGVVVLFGMSILEEDEVLRGLHSRIIRPVKQREDETATIEIVADKDEQILPGGPILLKAATPEHMVVIADALAKSVVLARDGREVSSVIEVIEPFARQLADKGRTPEGRRAILKHIGNALLVQHRVSGRVAVAEKPDAVWDRPDDFKNNPRGLSSIGSCGRSLELCSTPQSMIGTSRITSKATSIASVALQSR